MNNRRSDKIYHYSDVKQSMLEYLHSTTLKMLREIIPILEKEKICYSICGGTLRGAFLTGSFLPWDDDIDLCVLDDDYNKMINVLLTYLPDWIEVQCADTEPRYYHGWIKIRDKQSHIFPDEPIYHCNGVLIDIYRLKCVEENLVDYYIAKEHLDYLKRRYLVGGISKDEMNNRIEKNNLLKRTSISARTNDHIYVKKKCIVCSAIKIELDADKCFPTKRIIFEGLSVSCFKDSEYYLKCHYGKDYMILPPEEERKMVINRIDLIHNEK